MIATIDGLSYDVLMNLPMDEFIEVRNNVIRISRAREQAMKGRKRA